MFQTVNGAEWLTLKLGRKKMLEKAWSNLRQKTYGAVPVDDSRKIAQSGEWDANVPEQVQFLHDPFKPQPCRDVQRFQMVWNTARQPGADNSVPNGECLAGGCKAGVQRIDNTMTTTATPLECYAIKVQQRDGTERVLYNVSSKQVAMQIVDELNRNPWEIAWYEQRSPIGVK